MERKYLKNLENWYNDPFRKPMLIYGARQVGKTTLIKDIFAKKYYQKVIYIDFKIDLNERIYIKNHVNAKDIINYLSIRKNMIIDKDTLIIFDEIQECMPCLTALKYFEQDFKEIPVIATGSMIRIKMHQIEYQGNKIKLDPEIEASNQDGNNNYMFPTGKIDSFEMYPMDFNEYLYNRNRTLYNYLSDSFNAENKVLDNEMHNMAMSYVFEYMLVGGMPEIVDIYIKTNSYPRAKQNLMVLYNDYLNDMSLFQISQETIMRTKNVFNNVFKELNKENKNFKISEIEKGKRFRDYMYPLDWLSVGNIIYKSNQLKEKVTYPLANDEDSLFRIYLSDLGYFSLQSGLGAENFLTDLKSNTLSGIFFENFVACELKTRGLNLFYWKGKSTSELEFVIQLDGKIISIDAKKNKGSLDSLYKYRETNKNELAIKVSQNKYGYNEDNKLLTLPFYYLGFYLDSKKQ